MLGLLLALQLAHAEDPALTQQAPTVLDKIQVTRASISEDERRSREALSHLFVINKKVKDITRRQESLNLNLLNHEANVRTLAQEVNVLENRKEQQRGMLNKRLRQLYQERDVDNFHWLFSAGSPVELERNHRFLRRMIDSDHAQLKIYLSGLEELKHKRGELTKMVTRLATMQKEVQNQEALLSDQLREKSKLLAALKRSKDIKLGELKSMRSLASDLNDKLSYAFFERKGVLTPPIEAPLAREYGTYVDPTFRFRLTHKGLFYSANTNREIKAVFNGRVVFANRIPGYGKTVIVDHGDNYYTVYAFNSRLDVREGADVQEGDLLAVSGEGSPLFGPGLYFEIRHFTDAVDPRPWIKESVLKTADSGESI